MTNAKEAFRLISVLSELKPKRRQGQADLEKVLSTAHEELSYDYGSSDEIKAALALIDPPKKRSSSQKDTAPVGLLQLDDTLNLPVPFPGLGPVVRGVPDGKRLGPFVDAGGIDRWFVPRSPGKWQVIGVDSSEHPALVVPANTAREDGDEIIIKIKEGTLWIAAYLLDKNLKPDGEVEKNMVALSVLDAELRFRNAGDLKLATPPIGKLVSKLAYPEGEIEVCKGVALTAPSAIKINWYDGDVAVDLETATARIGEQEVKFHESSETPIFDADLERLIFPTKFEPEKVDLSELPHRIAAISGTAQITQAGWAVPVVTPSSPGSLPVIGMHGGWLMRLKTGTTAIWPGLSDETIFGEAILEIGTDGWFLKGDDAETSDIVQLNEGWDITEVSRQEIRVELPDKGPVTVGCDETRGNYVAFTGQIAGPFSRPLTTQGDEVETNPSKVSAIFTERSGGPRHYAVRAFANEGGTPARFAIENALIQVDRPGFDMLEAIVVDETRLINGALRIEMLVNAWLPILPDPYVSNVRPEFLQRGATPIIATVRWTDTAPSVVFSGALDDSGVKPVPFDPTGPRPAGIDPDGRRRGGLTASGRVLRTKKQQAEWDRARNIAQDIQVNGITLKAGEITRKATDRFNQPRIRLLDVSTNRDQIGVELLAQRRSRPDQFRLQGLQALTRMNDVRVFALPQIQWEPVRTLPSDQNIAELGYFPTPLASASDGGPTQISSGATRLSPTIPDLHLTNMVEEFKDGSSVDMVTTLPFGIYAYMNLRPANQPGQARDDMRLLRPSFKKGDDFGGAMQLVVEAGKRSGSGLMADEAFEGLAYQSANGVDLLSGNPQWVSVLGQTKLPNDGAVEAMFNREFTIERPKVPVKRLDICGYGGSTFSDWRNPLAAFAEAAKVEFQVLVGRTALEIIKFVSVLYPWGIRLTRTVTIERGSGAGVLRRDSGWQAVSDGLLDFTYLPEGAPAPISDVFDIHPGLIRGVYNARRIRTSDRPVVNVPSGGSVLPMVFDAEIEIGTDATSKRTAFRDIVGYLHLSPVGAPITPNDLALVLEQNGPAGGNVDTELEIDQSGFKCRVLRAEVGMASDGGLDTLCGSLAGVPRFGTAGSWSVAAFAGPAHPLAPPEAEVVSDGVPIIREGQAGPPVNGRIDVPFPSSEIRFADPQDMFQSGNPLRDYALVQSAPTHVFAYRRPSISVGSTVIDAGLPPTFTDVFARTNGSGLVPPETDSFVLPGNPKLVVDAGTGWPALNAPIATPVTRGPLQLSDGEDVVTRVDYSNASLSFDLQPDTWMVDMPGMKVGMDVFSAPDVTGMSFDLRGGSSAPNQIENIDTLMTPFLEDFLTFLPGFTNREKIPPVDLGATNAKVKAKIKTVGFVKFDIIPGSLAIKLSATFEAGNEEVTVPADPAVPGSTESTAIAPAIGGSIAIELRGAVPVSFGQFIYGCILELGGKQIQPVTAGGVSVPAQTKGFILLKAYVGFGFGGEAGPFKAKTVVALGPAVRYDGNWFGGGFLMFESEVAVIIVEIFIFAEFTLLIGKKDGKDIVSWTGEVGINVKVAVFLSIKMSIVISDEKEI